MIKTMNKKDWQELYDFCEKYNLMNLPLEEAIKVWKKDGKKMS